MNGGSQSDNFHLPVSLPGFNHFQLLCEKVNGQPDTSMVKCTVGRV